MDYPINKNNIWGVFSPGQCDDNNNTFTQFNCLKSSSIDKRYAFYFPILDKAANTILYKKLSFKLIMKTTVLFILTNYIIHYA